MKGKANVCLGYTFTGGVSARSNRLTPPALICITQGFHLEQRTTGATGRVNVFVEIKG